MDTATLSKVMGATASPQRYAELTSAFNEAMVQAGCTTVDRAAMWCAQLGHESVGLKYMTELWGPTADQKSYDGRMGNGPGEGYTYRGRGPIQLTGKNNYRACSQWAHARGFVPTATFLVDNPDAAADASYGFIGAVWYWTAARNMNGFADARDIEGASIAINGRNASGRANGIDDRIGRYNRAVALGTALLPTEEIDMSAAQNIEEQLLGPGSPEDRGWPQLGDHVQPENKRRRSLVDGVGRLIQIGNYQVEQQKRIELKLNALLTASGVADPAPFEYDK